MRAPLRVRWLGSVPYREALALQHGLFDRGAPDDWLLLLEHPHVYTLGARADAANVLVPPADVGAELVHADRGGDVTYHGPGQLVGYPILTLPGKGGGGMADTRRYVCSVEQLVIDVLADIGLPGASRLAGHPGVWFDADGPRPRKVAAVGVRLVRDRSMHGFALNVAPDLGYFDHIVPCGITDKAVTSVAAEGVDVGMREVVDAVVARAAALWAPDRPVERADVVWQSPGDPSPLAGELTAPGLRLLGRLAEAGVAEGHALSDRKPEWLRAPVRTGDAYRSLGRTMRELGLVTVCEEAGCPNIFECWADGTATFMLNGDRCTRACGFCMVDTSRPQAVDPTEPDRVAEAVARMGLDFVVLTTVARDDLADGGASTVAATVRAVRDRRPGVGVEVLISDCRGDEDALRTIFDTRPDVLNHNVETVPRLQRAARPSAGYARSLAVLARAKADGLTTKSGMVLGMGETTDEVLATLADLRGVGVDVVTLGQYLRPSAAHLPVARWWTPEELSDLKQAGEAMGIAHVEASPLTRSSYHARQAAEAVVVQDG